MQRTEKIAYLTGEYPAVSHTFILREVEALRAENREVITCSVRRTGADHHRGQAEKHAVDTTFYILRAAQNPILLLRAIVAGLATPGRFWNALLLAWSTRPPGLKAALYQIFYFVESLVLARYLRAQGVSHLHNHFGNSSCSVAMLTSAVSGIPFSYTMHGPAIFFEPRLWRIDEKIARARFVACISYFCRSQGMIFSAPEHWPKLRIVHCGITPENYSKRHSERGGKHIVFVGRLAAVKGILVLIDAFAKIHMTHLDATLTLVGDGSERTAVEAHIAGLDCSKAICLTGYLSQDEVAEELERADIFALPSFAEGVPVVLMEAMASYLPVVATRIAGVSELIEDGESGLTVPPGNVDALANALSELLADADLRQRMGRAGRARVETDYNITTEAAWLGQLMDGTAPHNTIRPPHDLLETEASHLKLGQSP